MIAVVVDGFKPGVTGWAAVRSTQSLKVRGLEEGHIRAFFDNGELPWEIFQSCDRDLPPHATRVKVELIKVEGCRVFVDLE